jgi:hypothetical protein
MNMPFSSRNAGASGRARKSLWKASAWILSAVLAALAIGSALALPNRAHAATGPQVVAAAAQPASSSSGPSASPLESAASRAGAIGRKVAMSLIALGFSVAAIALVFRRDFKEAAGVFVVGLLAILLATPAGVNILHDTVNTLFGA